MTSIAANGINIEYEEFGDPGDPVILLVMGFAAQMVVWPESFCRALAEHSFRVIRFDNRDVGMSTRFHDVKAPGMKRSMLASLLGIRLEAPYLLDDMAMDAIGILESLGIREAHFVGASMGGMIAQIAAAKHPGYVSSLTSLMSTSGSRKLPGPRPKVLKHVLFGHRKNLDREGMIEYLMGLWKLTASPAYPTPVDEKRRRVTMWVDRALDPSGNIRQFAAMAASGGRTKLLGTIKCPTLVIHGEDDPLIPVAGGRHTAECIAGSQLRVIAGMGHDLPEQLVPEIAKLIASHCAAAQNDRSDGPEEIAGVA
jgi:proline iminopeptidase